MRPGQRRDILAGGVLVALLGLSGLVLLARGAVPFTSDQALSLLMALDIRDNGKHPVFYWGVQYAGTFESHLLSLLFRVVSDSVAAYRLFLFSLVAATVLLVAAATRRAFGPRAGFLAGLYLALGPSFFLYKGLTSDGAYTSLLFFLAAALFALTELSREDLPAGMAPPLAALLGGSLGVAWWIHPLSIVFAPAAAISLRTPARRAARGLPFLALAAAFFLGSFPWWLKNAKTGFASLRLGEMAPVPAGEALRKLGSLVVEGIPMALGGRSAWTVDPTVPGGTALALAAFLFLVAVPLAGPAKVPAGPGRPLAFYAVLLAVGTPVLSFLIARSDFRWDARYLLPIYLGIAPLAGLALDRAAREPSRLALVAISALLVVLGPGSQLRARPFGGYQTACIEETRAFARDLTAQGIDGVYTNYWFAYRFHYLTGGRPPASPFGMGAGGIVRSVEMLFAVDRARRPAFVLEAPAARELRTFLRSRGERFTARTVPSLGLELVTDVPAASLEILRQKRYTPTKGALGGSLPGRVAVVDRAGAAGAP